MDKTFYKVNLTANQLLKLAYPEIPKDKDLMNFFEDGKDIGLLNFNSDKPDKSFINDKYKFYSNSSMNAGPNFFWMRFESIYNTNSEIGITVKMRNENDYDYYLLKLITKDKEKDDGELSWTKLYSLQKSDESIIRLDKLSNPYTFQLQRDFGQKKVIEVVFIVEFIRNGKMQTAENGRVPIFKIN